MGLIKKKEDTKLGAIPLFICKAQVKNETKSYLTNRANHDVTLVIPGLSGQAIDQLLEAIGADGMLNLQVMHGDDDRGQRANNYQS